MAERARLAEEAARAAAWEHAWQRSGFTPNHPLVVLPPTDWRGVITEALDMLRFDHQVVVGTAPDGSLRMRAPILRLRAQGLSGRLVRTHYDANTAYACIPVGIWPGSRDDPSRGFYLCIFPDGRIALYSNSNGWSLRTGWVCEEQLLERLFGDYESGDEYIRPAIVETICAYT